MLAPLAGLPRGAFVAALLLLNSAAWTTCIVASIYLATGRSAAITPRSISGRRSRSSRSSTTPICSASPPCFCWRCSWAPSVCLRRGRPITAGVLIAISAAIKAYPILAAGYLVYRRQWKAAAAMTAALAALMFIAPLPFRSPARIAQDCTLWVRGMLLKYDENSIAQRPDRAYSFKNQSVQATVHRLSRPVLADGEADRRWRVNLLDLDFRSTTFVMLGAVSSLGVFYLWATWRSG